LVAETGVDYARIWQQTLGTLDSGLSNQERAFVRLCRLVGVLDQIALVRAPNTFTKDFLETRVREQVHTALADQLGHPVQVAVSVDESLETDLGMISDEPTGQVNDGRRQAGSDSNGSAGHHNGLAQGGAATGSAGFGSPAHPRTPPPAHHAQHNPLRGHAESAPPHHGADHGEPPPPG
jgi:chromosomal replication initiator protein